MTNKEDCHNCKWKYSCGYTGCLSGIYDCCEEHSFERAEGKFWSLKTQKEVDEKTARKHWNELNEFGIVRDEKEK